MPPVTSNHGVLLSNWDTSTVEDWGFQMEPLLDIYTIHFKIVYLDNFRPYYVKSGKRFQTALAILEISSLYLLSVLKQYLNSEFQFIVFW